MESVIKLVVITEAGRVIGTQAIADPNAAITGGLRAGPGQQKHEIEIEAPLSLRNSREIQAFHDEIAKRLHITKSPQPGKVVTSCLCASP